MIPLLLVTGKFLYDVNKAINIDEKARAKMQSAYLNEEESRILINQKSEEVNIALKKVIQRKVGTLSCFRKFVELYQKIITIDFPEKERKKALLNLPVKKEEFIKLQQMVAVPKRELTDSEELIILLKGGLGGSMIKDSEIFLSQANQQMRTANIVHDQAVNLAKSMDILIKKCNGISAIISQLNLLLSKSIVKSQFLISERGTDHRKYTQEDRVVLMTSMNLADALKKIYDAPVITKDGNITQEMEYTMDLGRKYIQAIQKL